MDRSIIASDDALQPERVVAGSSSAIRRESSFLDKERRLLTVHSRHPGGTLIRKGSEVTTVRKPPAALGDRGGRASSVFEVAKCCQLIGRDADWPGMRSFRAARDAEVSDDLRVAGYAAAIEPSRWQLVDWRRTEERRSGSGTPRPRRLADRESSGRNPPECATECAMAAVTT
jgi:hypothetical protein